MSLTFLPWPLYLLLAFGVGVFLTIFAIILWKKEPKTLVISVWLGGVSSIIAGIRKIGLQFNYAQPFTDLTGYISFLLAIIAFFLLFVGVYEKVKINEEKRKNAIKAFAIAGLVLFLNFIFILYFYLKLKNIL